MAPLWHRAAIIIVRSARTFLAVKGCQKLRILECGQMPNVMVALPKTGGALCSIKLSYTFASAPCLEMTHFALASTWSIQSGWSHVCYNREIVLSRPSDHHFRSVCLSVCLSVCTCRVFLSRLWSDFDQTRTRVIRLDLVVSRRI